MLATYHGATGQDNEEPLYDARGAHDPRHTDKEDHAENVLNTGQEDTHQGSQIGL